LKGNGNGKGNYQKEGIVLPPAGLAIGTMNGNGLIEVNTNGRGIMILNDSDFRWI
jgi:hypothetical protein